MLSTFCLCFLSVVCYTQPILVEVMLKHSQLLDVYVLYFKRNICMYEFPFFQNLKTEEWSRMQDDNRNHNFAFSSFIFSALSAIFVLLISWQCNCMEHVWFYITSPELYWINITSTIVHSSKLSIEDKTTGSFRSQNCHHTTEQLRCVDDISKSLNSDKKVES